MMNKKPLIIITGPTAVGKSNLAVMLAKKIDGEIISADSMQVYKGMDIGTAKVTSAEMGGIKHHLIDVLEPDEPFNVVSFCQMAKECMAAIYSENKIPIIAGGTGFYIQALLYDIDFSIGDEDEAYREKLYKILDEEGSQKLHDMLSSVDPESAQAIHKNNVKRVIRALEFYSTTGKKISSHNQEEALRESPYNFAYFVLDDEREKIYEKIDKRVDLMINLGLEAEVRHLLEAGYDSKCQSMLGIGYKEFLDYFNGDYSLDEAIRLIKRESRHYAKKQITWFKREREVMRLYKPDFHYSEDEILKRITDELSKRGIV